MLAQLGMVTMALVIHRKFNKACKVCLHVWSIITPAQQGCLTDTQMVDAWLHGLFTHLFHGMCDGDEFGGEDVSGLDLPAAVDDAEGAGADLLEDVVVVVDAWW